MVAVVQVRLDSDSLRRAFKVAPGHLLNEFERAFTSDGNDFVGAMDFRFRGRPGLRARTGRLRRGTGKRVTRTATDITLIVFSAGLEYDLAQEFGAEIVPKNSKHLTVPMPDNLTPAGVPRFPSAREMMGLTFTGRSGKTRKLTSVIALPGRSAPPGMSRPLYIIMHDPAGGPPTFLWRLVKKTVIPGPRSTGTRSRFGFIDTWEAGQPRRDERHSAAIQTALNRSGFKGGG